MKTSRDTADLDANDQGRIDTNERFMKALEEGYRQARTKEELFEFMVKQMDLTNTDTEGTESERV
jgi:hypothetical protein